MRFHLIDLLVVLVVVRGVILGHRRGLSGEVLRFLGILFALSLSFRYYPAAADRFAPWLPDDENIRIASGFLAVFLAVFAFFYMLNQAVRHLARIPVISTVEKLGGAALGGAKAFLFACAALILLALVKVDRISNAVSRNSFFGPLAISAVPGAYRLAVHVYPPARELPADDVIEQLPSVKVNVAPEVIRSTGPLSGGEEPPPPGARTGAFGGTRERKVR